jgi:5'-nucleotidase
MPDLIVSGINHGSNASVNMLYSGTVAAAVEGALYGTKSIAFSNLNYDERADLSLSKTIVHQVIQDFMDFDFPPFTLLNVNIPAVSNDDFKGIRFCRQSLAQWKETFREENSNNGKTAFWLTGDFICHDKDENTDIWALENGYASLVPVSLDLTDYSFLNKLKKSIYDEKLR